MRAILAGFVMMVQTSCTEGLICLKEAHEFEERKRS